MDSGRVHVVAGAFAVAFVLMTARLVQLQVVDRGEFAGRAARQRLFIESIPARPGDIVDRHQRLLAVTIETPSLYLVPNRIDEPTSVARKVAEVLHLDAERLEASLRKNRDKSFLWVRRRLTGDDADAVRELDLPRDIWGVRSEYLRRYPQGVLAAHVLGLRNIDNIGQGGIEQRFDSALRGRDGRRVVRRDARGRAIDLREESTTPPEPGRTIVLSLDAVVQLFAEQALDELMAEHNPQGACAIVMEARTADVLALASRPTFDPNAPAEAVEDAWTNCAIAAEYEPGSTFKPLVVARALDAELIERDEMLDCEGGMYRRGRRVLHDHHAYGELSVTDVLVKSSNIGMAKIGERLGNAGLHDCVKAFGFGRATGLPLPGERSGRVRPLEHWNDYSTGSVPMGHEFAATPLQLITAHVALANGGRLVSPRLVLRDVDPVFDSQEDDAETKSNVETATPQVTSQAVGSDAARWVIDGPMVEVIRRGTGRAAQLEGIRVFGKTGTAQKFDAASGTFSHSRHVVSFIAGAPAEAPQIVVLVMADEPTGPEQGGGTVAAPVAAEILRRTLTYLGITSQPAERLTERVQPARS